ncbi:MAG: sensor histidine kinase [Clostridia bacterium]|nr:sensor histidine kinase [Clostridia bacterium]
MKYLFKVMFLIFIITELSINGNATLSSVFIVLMILASHIYREKYINSIILIALEFLIIVYGAFKIDVNFIFLGAVTTFDFICKKQYWGVIPAVWAGVYLLQLQQILIYFVVTGMCGFYAYGYSKFVSKDALFKEVYDKERRYRYELEQSKAKLLNSSKEIAYIAEVKERNRIAREIHDNVGHTIAGILLQLQASYKLFKKDEAKALGLVEKSISELSKSLELLRDTVHNIKPNERLGVEYIRGVIENFSFCPVDFRYSGDLSLLPAGHVEMITSNIKEALTNASKHSKATKMDISVDINENFVRIYIKDNGIGCSKMKEGLGLSGMKERVKNLGGSISLSSQDGFLIVCVIPMERVEGGGIFEGTNC